MNSISNLSSSFILKRDRRKPKLKDAHDERMMGEDDKISRPPKGARIALNFYQHFYLMRNISISCQIAFSFQKLLDFVILYPILYFVVFILRYILNFAIFLCVFVSILSNFYLSYLVAAVGKEERGTTVSVEQRHFRRNDQLEEATA